MVKLDETLANLYYDKKGAREALGISLEKFDYWMELGIIHAVTLPHLKHRLFVKAQIDQLGRHLEALLLTAARGSTEFRRATVADMDKEDELAYLIFGEPAINPDIQKARRAFIERNPDITYHLYERGLLVCSLNIVPLEHWCIEAFKEGQRGWAFPVDAIKQFAPGEPLETIIIDFMSTPVVPSPQRTFYAMQLLVGFSEVLEGWGARGVDIARVLASGGTKDGRRLLEGAGFAYLGLKGQNRHIYELVMREAKIKLVSGYKEALEAYKMVGSGK